jgi:Tol biopolymer transport system component
VNEGPPAQLNATNPTWSPDGRKLLYGVPDLVGGYIHAVDLVAGTDTLISGAASTTHPFYSGIWSPDSSRVALFTLDASENEDEVWMATLDGAEPVRVSPTPLPAAPGGEFALGWSADGQWFAFSGQFESPGRSDLYTVSADGSTLVMLTEGAANVSAKAAAMEWAPTGHRLAFIWDPVQPGKYELYAADADGSSTTKIVGFASPDRSIQWITWSPDGSKVAFIADRDTNDVLEPFVVAPTGGLVTKLGVAAAGEDLWDLAWSPDGAYAATVFQGAAGAQRLEVVASTGGVPVPVAATLAGSGGFSFIRWKPRGGHVLSYLKDPGTSGALELFTRDLNGGVETRRNADLPVTNPPTRVRVPLWSPDGSRLLYTIGQGNQANGGLFVTNGPASAAVRVDGGSLVTGGFDWSEGGDSVVFAGLAPGNPFVEVYRAAADGSGITPISSLDPNFAGVSQFRLR